MHKCSLIFSCRDVSFGIILFVCPFFNKNYRNPYTIRSVFAIFLVHLPKKAYFCLHNSFHPHTR